MAEAPASLSVVIPTHDTRELTLRCLASLHAEAAAATEILLVDDGGSDGTAEEAGRRFPSVRVIRRSRRGGFSEAANEGLAAAQGDLLLLLNSDTAVGRGALAALRAAFGARPRLGIAGAALSHPDGRPQWSGGAEPTTAWLFLAALGAPALLGRLPGYRKLWPLGAGRHGSVDWVSGAAMALRRATWEQVRPLDASFAFYGQDLDVCLRARDAGWEVSLLPEVKVLHHGGATIGRQDGATGEGVHPALLWTDLLRFVHKRRGLAAARRAAGAVRAGIRLRLLSRGLGALVRPSASRATWRRENEALRRGHDAVASWRNDLT
jgi:hypothetical protein